MRPSLSPVLLWLPSLFVEPLEKLRCGRCLNGSDSPGKLLHVVTQIDQALVKGLDLYQTDARVFDIENHID